MSTSHDFIAVFDSGVGGVSILQQLYKQLPCENFRYLADCAHVPYGEKPCEWIQDRSHELCRDFIDAGAKAVVIACNTATSAAAEKLRQDFSHIPVIGVEPALKPASEKAQRILVMATPLTLKLEKYQQLADKWGSGHEVINAPCPGLADRIEQGNLQADDMRALIEKLVGDYRKRTGVVVLGCTHYPFVADQICSVLGDVAFFDSALGTARHVKRRLTEEHLLKEDGQKGNVEFMSSDNKASTIKRLQDFFRLRIDYA